MPFRRKNIRLSSENYVGKRSYFVTVCTKDRRPAFRDGVAVTAVLDLLRDLAKRYEFAVHAYCVMPDHVHILAEGLSHQSRLQDFVNRFKQQTAYEHERKFSVTLWQFKSYDHILRRTNEIENVAWYIWMNPVRKGLSSEPHDYPFSGSFTISWITKRSPNPEWTPPWKRKAAIK